MVLRSFANIRRPGGQRAMKTLFIVNPIAGRNKSIKIWEKIRHKIYFPHEYILTGAPGEAREIAAEAVSNGFIRVVAVGGDGTVSEVINGIANSDAVLGIIPTGTGNDFVRSLGISLNPIDALFVLVSGYSERVDLGIYDGRFFMNIAGAGLDAEVVKIANKKTTYLTGSLAYVVSLIAALKRFSPRKAIIDIDGKTIHRTVWLISVANGKYYGGGMKLCPQAMLNDGYLDICIVNEISRFELLRFLPKVFKGAHINHPSFEVIRGKQVKINFCKPCSVQVDGEVIGKTPLEILVSPNAIRVIMNKRKR
jgi:diacylglycerol kinase (ATP)